MKWASDYLDFIRDDIKALSAYKVQESDNLIKLDAMENPFELPDIIRQEWMSKAATLAVNRYPDPKAKSLANKLRAQLGLPENADILFGNGSDEIIQMLMMAVAKPEAKILSVEPGFVMYKMIAKFCGLEYIGVDLNKDFSLDIESLKNKILAKQPTLIFLAQPNNPTGNLFLHEDLCEIIECADGLVVIDEAYTAFTDYDALSLLETYSNVLVMRTFSKTGLAGLRLGYLLGDGAFIGELDKIRLPYNINVLTQGLAECALENYDLLLVQSQQIIQLREALIERLSQIEQCEAYPSEANFIVVRMCGISARSVFQTLKEQGILIKLLDGAHPLLKNCLRLTVGSEEENKKLLDVLGDMQSFSA